MKNMVYIQSGGPTSVINSSLYGAIIEAKKHPDVIEHIFGSLFGIEGLINDNLFYLDKEDEEQIELLKQTPGAALKSTRLKLPEDLSDPVFDKIIDTIVKRNIGFIFVNGGNDSMDTCARLSKLTKERGLDVRVMGVPKTIDNDLAVTDHTIGFGSAAKYVCNMVAHISVDARCFKKGKVHLVEIMGRDAGWLTASTDVLPERFHPDLIYIPEEEFVLDKFLKDVKRIYDEKGSVIVAVSEGVTFGERLAHAKLDNFGHPQLEGIAKDLSSIIDETYGLKTRAVELSIPQRACVSLISKSDQEEAIRAGEEAVKAAVRGESGKMVILKRVSDNPYTIEYEVSDVAVIANKVKKVPTEWIVDNTRMSEEFRTYIRPLIKGETEVKYKDGIALFTEFKKIKVE